jgi:hypothetical protein
MTYFVGTMISSVYKDKEITEQNDLEFYLAARVIHQVIFERAVAAYNVFRNADLFNPEVTNRTVSIIGTNDEDLKLFIEAELQNLRLQYIIKEDYIFAKDSSIIEHYDESGNFINSDTFNIAVSAKYMFFLTSMEFKDYNSPVIARTGVEIKPKTKPQWFKKALEIKYEGYFLPEIFSNKNNNPKNAHYSTEVIDVEELNISEAMLAVKDILEVIALTYTDNFYYFLENQYEENFTQKSDSPKEEPEQKNDSNSFPISWVVIFVLLIVAIILFN